MSLTATNISREEKLLIRLQGHWIAVRENLDSVVAIKKGIAQDDLFMAEEAWMELDQPTQIALYSGAETKGGVWYIHERDMLRKLG